MEQEKIEQSEADTLSNLYKIANESNKSEHWHNIDTYFEVLGKKYKFEPKDIAIDTDGNIMKVRKCYRCGGVANSIRGIKHDRVKEGKHYKKYPICTSCWMKRYPHKAKTELLKMNRKNEP